MGRLLCGVSSPALVGGCRCGGGHVVGDVAECAYLILCCLHRAMTCDSFVPSRDVNRLDCWGVVCVLERRQVGKSLRVASLSALAVSSLAVESWQCLRLVWISRRFASSVYDRGGLLSTRRIISGRESLQPIPHTKHNTIPE